MRELEGIELSAVAGGFSAPHADGGGVGMQQDNQFDQNNLGVRIPYYENGRMLGYMVADGHGTRYVDHQGSVQWTEDGREQQELAREQQEQQNRREREEFRNSPIVSQILNLRNKLQDLVDGGR